MLLVHRIQGCLDALGLAGALRKASGLVGGAGLEKSRIGNLVAAIRSATASNRRTSSMISSSAGGASGAGAFDISVCLLA